MNNIIIPLLPFRRISNTKTKKFVFSNHHLYSDVPNDLIIKAYQEILEKCDNKPLNKAKKCADRLIKEDNDSSKEEFKKWSSRLGKPLKPFFTLFIRANVYGNKPFLFGYYLNRKEFFNFLNVFSESDEVTLYEKYGYIEKTKFFGDELSLTSIFSFQTGYPLVNGDSISKFHTDFEEAIKTEKAYIINVLDGLLNFLRKMIKKFKNTYRTSFILRYVPDIITEIYEIRALVENGYISACYREMRSLIERLSWFILDDYLSANSFGYWKDNVREMPSFVLSINPLWYEKEKKEPLRGLKDLIPENIDKEFKKRLIKNMSIEMYIVLSGNPAYTIPKDENGDIITPYAERDIIGNGIKEVEESFESVKSKNNLGYRNIEDWIQQLKKKWDGFEYGIPKIPTSNFVFQFLINSSEKKKDIERLQSTWNKYSLFTHPYLATLQVLPNFSILEYKVLKHEIDLFESLIKTEIYSLFKYVKNLG
ncbi:MAG: hypothetical protein QXJ62_06980 [Nitrososphaeria archaeon]